MSENVIVTKICTRCNTEKTYEEFGKDKTKLNGLGSRCKQCKREEEAIRRSKEGFLEKRREYDNSEHGKRLKKVSDEKYRSTDKYKETIRDYYNREEVKDRIKSYKKSEAWKNYQKEYNASEKAKESKRKWSSSEKGRRSRQEWAKTETAEQFRKRYKESSIGKIARKNATNNYFANNPGKKCYYESKRRASKLLATPTWYPKQEEEILLLYKLATEMSTSTGKKYHVDHIVPLQSKKVCGLHCLDNLQILLGIDNVRKNNLTWPDMP